MIKVVQFQRRPFSGAFSVEGLFSLVREEMVRQGVNVAPLVLPYFSKGLIQRALSTVWAAWHQADINHVTGDIQFVCLGLVPERTILTVLDCVALDRLKGWRFRVMLRYWYEIPCKRAAAITVISHDTRNDLLKYLPNLDPEKIHVIPVPVSPRYRWQPAEFRSACPRILQIGTKENKNVIRLVQALRGVSCTLVVVGILTDEQRNEILNSEIEFENYVEISDDEMARLYAGCDLLTFVSTKEGFGIPILEAQAVGRPVVSSNCSSMPSVAGAGACLIDPFDVSSIRCGISKVISDSSYRSGIISAGRINVERFKVTEIAARYLALYKNIASIQDA